MYKYNVLSSFSTLSLFLLSILSLISLYSNFDISSSNKVFAAQQMILNHSQGDSGAQARQDTHDISNNLSDFCPANTNLQLKFIKEVITDGYIVTCTLDNPFVYVTWRDNTLGNNEIFFRASNDSGKTFGPVINLSNNTENSEWPQIAAVSNHVYVTWRDSFSNISFRASDNNGKTFGPVIQLSNSATSGNLQIAAVGDHVYVTWRGYQSNIFFSGSDNNGKTFGPVIKINTDGTVGGPLIAAVGAYVYVIWENSITDISFRASDNNGKTFGPIIQLSNSSGTSGYLQQISAIGNNIYVTWVDNVVGNYEIFFSASDNNGKTFGPVIQLSNSTVSSSRSQIAAAETLSGSFVYVIWRDFSGDSEIFFRASNDSGKTFGPVINLSNKIEGLRTPEIAAVDEYIYVSWDGFPNENIFRTSNDSGKTFGPVIKLRPTHGFPGDVQIAAVDDHVSMIWRGTPISGYIDIYFRSSNNNGQTFGTILNLSNNTGVNLQSQIAVPSS